MRIHDCVGPMVSALFHPPDPPPRRAGWCYAALCEDGDLLKIGGTKGCPVCRVQNINRDPKRKVRARMQLVAACFSEDWALHEQSLLGLNVPVIGNEWFAARRPELCWKSFVDWLCDNQLLHRVWDLQMMLARRYG